MNANSTNAPVEACPKCGVLRPFLPPDGWCQTCGYSPSYEARVKEAFDFLAATSLCEGCQKKREERRIIATPRIQVEEERDRLRADSRRLDALLKRGWVRIPDTKEPRWKTLQGGLRTARTRDEIDEVLGEHDAVPVAEPDGDPPSYLERFTRRGLGGEPDDE